jgi:hypothetical protein
MENETTLCFQRPKCHLSGKIYRLPDNLPRCQALGAGYLSRIMWRDIIFLFRGAHSSSIWLSFLASGQDM